MRRTHIPFLIVALLACGTLYHFTQPTVELLRGKATAEQQEMDHFNRWLQTYTSLSGVKAQWDKTYGPSSEIVDMLSLYRHLGLEKAGLISSPDDVQLSKIDPVQRNSRYLDLNSACVTSKNSQGLTVTARNFAALLDGVKALANRPDIRFDEVFVDADNHKPRAILSNFCLLVRDDPTAPDGQAAGASTRQTTGGRP